VTITETMFGMVKASRQALAPEGLQSLRGFFTSAQDAGGAFVNRASAPDLYYTVFGIESCLALAAPFDRERAAAFVRNVGEVDLVHHCCRIRCANRLGLFNGSHGLKKSLRSRLNRLVAASLASGGGEGVKGAFLAALAYEDLDGRIPNSWAARRLIRRYERSDGSFANVAGARGGLVTATAAAVVVLRRLTGKSPERSVAWLRSLCMASGGFRVSESVPLPDLLSTATALFALRYCGESLDGMADACEEFIAGLWQPCGGFAGHEADGVADCEYTYYALLALGCLA